MCPLMLILVICPTYLNIIQEIFNIRQDKNARKHEINSIVNCTKRIPFYFKGNEVEEFKLNIVSTGKLLL